MANDKKSRAIMSSFDDEILSTFENLGMAKYADLDRLKAQALETQPVHHPSVPREGEKKDAQHSNRTSTKSVKPVYFKMDETLWEHLRDYCFKKRVSKTDAVCQFVREGLKKNNQ